MLSVAARIRACPPPPRTAHVPANVSTILPGRRPDLDAGTSSEHTMKAHILVVDDDPRITDLVRRILAYAGYSVTSAATGDDALARTLERPPDAVVLDIMLPGLDGLEVTRRLRAAGDNVPILLLTGKDAVPDRVTGLK